MKFAPKNRNIAQCASAKLDIFFKKENAFCPKTVAAPDQTEQRFHWGTQRLTAQKNANAIKMDINAQITLSDSKKMDASHVLMKKSENVVLLETPITKHMMD